MVFKKIRGMWRDMSGSDELLTSQVAEKLGIRQPSVRQAILRGSLAATKRGRDWYISRREVRRYQEENQQR